MGTVEGDVRAEFLRLAFAEGNRSFADQTDALNQARNRAGLLLSAGSVAASFLGKAAIDKFDSADRPWGFWACWVIFLVLGLVCAAVLMPTWTLTTYLDPRVLASTYASANATTSFEGRMVDLIRRQGGYVARNDTTLKWLHWLLTAALGLLTFGTAGWL